MIDQVGKKKWLGCKLPNFLPVLLIVRGSGLRTSQHSRKRGDEKSRRGWQPQAARQTPPGPSKFTQVPSPKYHHRLAFIFFAPNRPLHRVTARTQQTFQAFYGFPASSKNRVA
jgi:hypothetical protein